LLTESYFEIAEEALNRSIVDPNSKPSIQDFRVDLGAGINPAPLAEKLVLGADSLLLENPDFLVTQLTPLKPFAFEPFFMRTKYRFIEGYRGNDTVRGNQGNDTCHGDAGNELPVDGLLCRRVAGDGFDAGVRPQRRVQRVSLRTGSGNGVHPIGTL